MNNLNSRLSPISTVTIIIIILHAEDHTALRRKKHEFSYGVVKMERIMMMCLKIIGSRICDHPKNAENKAAAQSMVVASSSADHWSKYGRCCHQGRMQGVAATNVKHETISSQNISCCCCQCKI